LLEASFSGRLPVQGTGKRPENEDQQPPQLIGDYFSTVLVRGAEAAGAAEAAQDSAALRPGQPLTTESGNCAIRVAKTLTMPAIVVWPATEG
jgi:hypothetical protein